MRIGDAKITIDESSIEILDKDERMELAKLAVSGDKKENQTARVRLILSMTRFIIQIATKKYFLHGADLEEAIQESYLKLFVYFSPAAKRGGFNPELGYDPTTYAGHVIDSAIQRFINGPKNMIAMPTNVSARIWALKQELESHETITKKEFEKFLEQTGLSKLLLTQYEKSRDLASLDTSSAASAVPDKKALGFDEKIFKTVQAQKILQEAFESLTQRETEALKLRYGLDDGQFYTNQEIGEKLGVSRNRASQICLSAERKIRHWLKNRHPEYLKIIEKQLLN